METYMKVNGKMVKKRVKENIFMQMKTFMKVNGKIIIETVKYFEYI
jgi:peptidyl-tRNA hydrolase